MKRVLVYKKNIVLMLLLGLLFSLGLINTTVKVNVYPTLRKIQKEIILFKTRDFLVRETAHFILRYDKEDQEVLDLVAKAAEARYEEMTQMFDYQPEEKSIVIVYNDSAELMKNARLGKGKPPMGVYYASTIQILSPREWVSDHEDMENTFMNEGPMVHEFTHLLVDDLTKGNYPLWFTEGIALYEEYVQTGYEWGKELEFEGDPYTVKQLTKEFTQLDEMLAYKRSFEIIRDFIKIHGFHNMNQLLHSLGQGHDFKKAHEEIFGDSIEELYDK